MSFLRRLFLKKSDERSGTRWSLAYAPQGWIISDLSVHEARAILATLNEQQWSQVYLQRHAIDSQWRSLLDPVGDVLREARELSFVVSSLPPGWDSQPRNQIETHPESQVSATAQVISLNSAGPRKYERYPCVLPVTIISGNQEFHTFTEDLSAGGMRLREVLPDWVAGYCTVLLQVSAEKNMELHCSLAEDQMAHRTRLEVSANENMSPYLDWVKELAHQQKKQSG